ncbi:hypothetical protein D3C71_1411980 [compost metagenome]
MDSRRKRIADAYITAGGPGRKPRLSQQSAASLCVSRPWRNPCIAGFDRLALALVGQRASRRLDASEDRKQAEPKGAAKHEAGRDPWRVPSLGRQCQCDHSGRGHGHDLGAEAAFICSACSSSCAHLRVRVQLPSLTRLHRNVSVRRLRFLALVHAAVGIHGLPFGGSSFCPHPRWVRFGCKSTAKVHPQPLPLAQRICRD